MKKNLLIITVALLLGLNVSAQTVADTTWTRTIGSSYDDAPGAYDESKAFIEIASDGSIYVLTNIYTPVPDGWVNSYIGSLDIWLVKMNQEGDTLWTKVIGGTGYDAALDIIATEDGGCAIAGFTNSNDGDLTGNHDTDGSHDDGFIMRLGPESEIIWSKLYGGGGTPGGQDQLFSIIQTSQGTLLASGQSTSINGDLPFDLTKFAAGWVLEVNVETGAKIVSKRVAGSNHDEYNANTIWDIKELADQSGYIGLGKQNYGLSSGIWLAKINYSGDTIWTKEFYGGSDNSPRAIVELPDGGFIAAVAIYGDSDAIDNYLGGFSDIWLLKMDANGNEVKQESIGGSDNDMIYGMIPDNKSGFLTAGFTRSSDFSAPGTSSESDFYIVNFTEGLDTIRTFKMGGSDTDILSDIKVSPSGDVIYTVGRTESTDNYIHNNNGDRDIWIAKIESETTSVNSIKEISNLKIYPNPCNNFVKVKLETPSSITVSDISGRTVYKSSEKLSEHRINTTTLQNGIYFISTGRKSQKMVINH